MSAPPPPPPPPPPSAAPPASAPNKNALLSSIRSGSKLKPVSTDLKNDRSEVQTISKSAAPTPGGGRGPMVPPGGPMSIADAIKMRAAKNNPGAAAPMQPRPMQPPIQMPTPKRPGAPAPNQLPSSAVPGAPKPPNKELKPVISTGPPPPPPPSVPKPMTTGHNIPSPPRISNSVLPPAPPASLGMSMVPPPPPPAKDKPFRPPLPMIPKPGVSTAVQPPPPPPQIANHNFVPPKNAPPPPPPPPPISSMPNYHNSQAPPPRPSSSRPAIPRRDDSNTNHLSGDFDSRFRFVDMSTFPSPKSRKDR